MWFQINVRTLISKKCSLHFKKVNLNPAQNKANITGDIPARILK